MKRFIPKRMQNPLCWGSLLLNIVLIGVFLIGPHRLLPFMPPPKPEPGMFLEHMGRDLTGQDKVVFTEILDKHRHHFSMNEQKMHDVLFSISKIISREPFKIHDVEIAHIQLTKNRINMDKTITDFMQEMLPALSHEGRKKLRILPPHMQTE